MWPSYGDPLPHDFDWSLVAKNYARRIRAHIKQDPDMGRAYAIALAEEQAAALHRIAPLEPGFNLAEYRTYLRNKFDLLPLSAMHTTTYDTGARDATRVTAYESYLVY